MIRQSFLDYIAPRQLLIILLQLTSKTKKKLFLYVLRTLMRKQSYLLHILASSRDV